MVRRLWNRQRGYGACGAQEERMGVGIRSRVLQRGASAGVGVRGRSKGAVADLTAGSIGWPLLRLRCSRWVGNRRKHFCGLDSSVVGKARTGEWALDPLRQQWQHAPILPRQVARVCGCHGRASAALVWTGHARKRAEHGRLREPCQLGPCATVCPCCGGADEAGSSRPDDARAAARGVCARFCTVHTDASVRHQQGQSPP